MAAISPDMHLFVVTGTNPGKDTTGMNDNDQMLTLSEVADYLRTPVATLRYWRHVGIGPQSFKVGRHVRYYREDVDAWLRDQRQRGGRAAG